MSKKRVVSHDEAKEHDAFISATEKLGPVLAKNKVAIIVVAVILVLMGGGYTLMSYLQGQRSLSASRAFYEVDHQYSEIQTQVESLKQEIEKLNVKPKKETQKELNQRLADLEGKKKELKAAEDRIPTLIPLYSKMALEHKGTASAFMAYMTLSHIYFETNKIDSAITAVQEGLSAQPGPIFFTGLGSLKLATLWMYKKNYEEALKVLDRVTQEKQLKFLHAEAWMKKGICQQKLGQLDAAEETFTKISEEYTNSESGRAAKRYLNLIKFQKSQVPQKSS